jgi:hypothetical protein
VAGSCHSVTAREFHDLCDDRMYNLTLILQTEVVVFDHFTPVKGKTPDKWRLKSDDNL